VETGDRKIELDQEGYMIEPEIWDEEVAKLIAREEGIDDMTDKHWEIVKFIRDYWKEHDLAPSVRLLCREMDCSVRDVYKLFTSGPAKGACRIAGLPKPEGCV
jgi:tRNA 2-thiouridine synthesizing protein E